jgi:hypothetical protein
MRIRPSLGAGWGLALCAACFGAAAVDGAPVECPQASVRVAAAVAQDALDVCAAAGPVFTFFREAGLDRTIQISVSVVAGMPEDLGPAVLGCFTPDDQRTLLLTFESAKARGSWLGRTMDRALYRSLAAHEIAHALAWCNTADGPLSVRAREYVAYVAMFETMDPRLRQAILAQTPGSGFDDDRDISDLHFYLAPSSFGADVYRHYLRPENGRRFLREVLRGAALPPLEE